MNGNIKKPAEQLETIPVITVLMEFEFFQQILEKIFKNQTS